MLRKLLIPVFLLAMVISGCSRENPAIRMAVEFMDHASPAYVARQLGWYEEEGLNIITFNNYSTGSALAGALSRGEADAAYICLIPAINAYANGKVPLKIVAGTHRYGYGVLADPRKVHAVEDLDQDRIRIGCTGEGTVMDALMHKTIEKYGLDEEKVLGRVRRMAPQKLLLALRTGQVDVAFMPEQYPTMGEEFGFVELLSARDLWPGMQGSVLIVTQELIDTNPQAVSQLVRINRRGIEYIRSNPKEAASIVAEQLKVIPGDIVSDKNGAGEAEMAVTPGQLLRSMQNKLEFDEKVETKAVQDAIDFLERLGYIKGFDASDMMDGSFYDR